MPFCRFDQRPSLPHFIFGTSSASTHSKAPPAKQDAKRQAFFSTIDFKGKKQPHTCGLDRRASGNLDGCERGGKLGACITLWKAICAGTCKTSPISHHQLFIMIARSLCKKKGWQGTTGHAKGAHGLPQEESTAAINVVPGFAQCALPLAFQASKTHRVDAKIPKLATPYHIGAFVARQFERRPLEGGNRLKDPPLSED